MHRVTGQTITLILILLALVLSGCSDFDEMKGQRLLNNAEVLLEQGNEEGAESLLADLVARYPSSQAAVKGQRQLQYIQTLREKRERLNFSKILDSYKQVLNGYRSMYAEYPQSVEALDGSDYFFDFSYLAEITPNDYQVFLFLQNDGSGYRIWCVRGDSERGYVVDAAGQDMAPFERAETLEHIKSSFRSEKWNDKVVTLHLL